MGYYMVQAAFSQSRWEAYLKDPQAGDRLEGIRPAIEQLGGTISGVWYSFGEYDLVAIVQLPDNVSAAAFSMVPSAIGSAKSIKTTPLMTMEEGVEALRKAGKPGG